MAKPPFSIGQNAAEYGRQKGPRSPRGQRRTLITIAVVCALLATLYYAIR